MSRDAFLARVRAALGRTAEDPVPPLDAPVLKIACTLSQRNRVETFVQAFTALNGTAIRVTNPVEARDAVADLIRNRTAVAACDDYLQSCGIPDLPGVTNANGTRAQVRAACVTADFGITGVTWALAETGTFAMLACASNPRLVSLLPPAHIAVFPASRIVTNLDEVFASEPLPAEKASSLVLITGPSRTADIEQILVRGVHGPGQVYAVICENVEQE